MDLVESHVHIWTIRDPQFGRHPESDFTPDIEAAPADLFRAQEQVGGVAWTVLIQPRYYLWDNSYLIQAAETYPHRLVVAGRVDPLLPHAPDALRDLMEHPQVRGIRLAPNTDPETRWLDDPSQDALWETAADTSATIGLLINWRQLPQADVMARRHPGVHVVIDHLGSPDYQDPDSLSNLLSLADRPNVFVKLSGYPNGTHAAYPYQQAHPLIERVFRAYGAQRLMWGTDWPVCLTSATYMEAFNSAWNLTFLTDADREWVFARTAKRAWRIEA